MPKRGSKRILNLQPAPGRSLYSPQTFLRMTNFQTPPGARQRRDSQEQVCAATGSKYLLRLHPLQQLELRPFRLVQRVGLSEVLQAFELFEELGLGEKGFVLSQGLGKLRADADDHGAGADGLDRV